MGFYISILLLKKDGLKKFPNGLFLRPWVMRNEFEGPSLKSPLNPP
jgi:hypothetical protein